MEYFEMSFRETAKGYWLVYYANDQGETSYGPFHEVELLSKLAMAPFFFEEIVFIYHLLENGDQNLRELGVRLLKN